MVIFKKAHNFNPNVLSGCSFECHFLWTRKFYAIIPYFPTSHRNIAQWSWGVGNSVLIGDVHSLKLKPLWKKDRKLLNVFEAICEASGTERMQESLAVLGLNRILPAIIAAATFVHTYFISISIYINEALEYLHVCVECKVWASRSYQPRECWLNPVPLRMFTIPFAKLFNQILTLSSGIHFLSIVVNQLKSFGCMYVCVHGYGIWMKILWINGHWELSSCLINSQQRNHLDNIFQGINSKDCRRWTHWFNIRVDTA